LDDQLSPSYRFDATYVPRTVADDLLASHTHNKRDNRYIIEFAHDV